MPWRVTTVEAVRLSFCERVLLSEESFSSSCREFGISRKTGYKWLRRYREAGAKGLSDRRRRPRRSPGRASAVLEALVVGLKERYPYWGPRKLHRLLYQNHPEAERVGISTVGRILSRQGLVIPREEPVVHPTVGRFERAEPNELWQMDLKLAMRLSDGRRRYVAGILDDHSRYALGLWWLPDISDTSVLSCWIAAARRYGLPQQTLTDHGAQFCMGDHTTASFRVYLWACGVRHCQGRIGYPQTQGKIERFWGTFQRELTPQLRENEPSQWPVLMETWREQYNTLRPHESLADRPPASRYRKSDRAFEEPDRNARIGQEGSIYRRVGAKGEIHLGGRRLTVGRGLAHWVVEARALGNGCWHVYFRNHFLREFMLTKPKKSVTHVPEQL
jgi:transposase InsO family protein